MRLDKQLAIKLRREGKSYLAISGILGISKSTLSNWFSGVTWSEKTKHRLTALVRKSASARMTVISHRRRDELSLSYEQQRKIAIRVRWI